MSVGRCETQARRDTSLGATTEINLRLKHLDEIGSLDFEKLHDQPSVKKKSRQGLQPILTKALEFELKLKIAS